MSPTDTPHGRLMRPAPQPFPLVRAPSGHVFTVQREHGLVWYAKYRTGTGHQVQKKLGPAWTRRGRPPAGHHTRSTAERWLNLTLQRIRQRTMPPVRGTPAGFDEAAAEWLRHVEHDRGRKPTTLRGYRILLDTHLRPAFGGRQLSDLSTEEIERVVWSTGLAAASITKLIVCMSGIYHRARRVWGITYDPVDDVQRPQLKPTYDLEVYTPAEVLELTNAAVSERDAAIFLTAALAGLRLGEVVALAWRDVDLDRCVLRVRRSWSGHELTTPKAGKVRSVPLAPQVIYALRDLRPDGGDLDALVFPGRSGGHLDRRALRRRYHAAQERAGLRQLRFHDLRHTFATTMVAHTSIRRVQEWLGHSDLHSTMRYLHYTPRHDDAELVARAFRSG